MSNDSLRMEKNMKYLLFNPYSANGECKAKAEEYAKTLEGSQLVDMTATQSYGDFFESLSACDEIIICGGDGTLNRFINDTQMIDIKNNIYYTPMGTGNDFYADIKTDSSEPVLINDYIKNLPTVDVKGKKYRFINGVGYGIDGYCCEVGDALHAEGKPANYTAIAIKGLLFHFKPVNATVIVDGEEHIYKKVWLAPTMFGRRYGGGMIPTPAQERNGDRLSVMLFHGSGKLKTLMIFPLIFKGEHIKNEKYVTVLSGKDITVKFDSPRALQVDGETILAVEEYHASV